MRSCIIRPFIVLAGAALIAACAKSPESFEPAERATALTARGYLAAEYELRDNSGALGEVRVWSNGARWRRIGAGKRTVLHVAFEIENNSNRPFHLVRDSLQLDSATTNEGVMRDIGPYSIEGSLDVPRGASRTVHVFFTFPEEIKPQEIDAFRLKWKVSNSTIAYTQRTPFLEQRDYAYYYSPFYDPFYYDPFYYPYAYYPTVRPYGYPYRHRLYY